eukprot:NODE_3872_length_902_cov_20.373974_g3566_i0.p1 GENE.NODE_3872_length_902_cov_20.373974_g3566_i0~~NODE_3872_length_902_cov_20.373974_g3566_i0.p1  ORF type:complete len:184 (-),score=28.49 NODE_3872_length_902_cov_20.373974_g3566_i0:227-778(-)
MFGCIVPGFAPQQNFQQVDPQRWVLTFCVPLASDQLVVYLAAGATPLPPGLGGGVYISKMGEPAFEYLGCLTNEKPSAIVTIPTHLVNNVHPHTLCVGVSLDTVDNLRNLDGEVRHRGLLYLSRKAELATQIGRDLYNYLQSFAKPSAPGGPADMLVVPSSILDKWMERLAARIQLDAKFSKD